MKHVNNLLKVSTTPTRRNITIKVGPGKKVKLTGVIPLYLRDK